MAIPRPTVTRSTTSKRVSDRYSSGAPAADSSRHPGRGGIYRQTAECDSGLPVPVKTAAIILLLVSAGDAVAGGFGIPEVGARRTGMAAVVGRPDEANAVYHNPAGLALGDGVRVYASFGLAMLDASFQLQQWDQSDRFIDAPVDADGYYPSVTPTRAMAVIPMLAVTAELLDDKLWGAFSVYVPNGTGARFGDDSITRYHLIDGYTISPLGQLSVAYKPSRYVSIGAGFGMMNLRLKGQRDVFPIIDGADASSLLGSDARLELAGSTWTPTWNAGVLVAPIKGLTIGAAVTGRVDAKIEGPIKLTFGQDAASPGMVTEARQQTSQLLPWTFSAGANYDVHPNIEIGSEFRYWLYRQYDEQNTRIMGTFLVRELTTQKDYHDSWQISGGVRVHGLAKAPGLELMLGGHKDTTPAPTKSLTLDSPTFSHVGLHSGVRYERGRTRIGLTYLHYWYDVPVITDSMTGPPSNVRGGGSNNIVSTSLELTFK
jgi:long-subunit fatty acid transport protein